MSDSSVLLISMPFGQLAMPSIALSLLKATLTENQISSRIYYFTFNFSNLIGIDLYSKIAAGAPANIDLVGEWIFGDSLFGPSTQEEVTEYVNSVLRGIDAKHSKEKNNLRPVSDDFIKEILSARESTESFLDDCANRILENDPKIVGFTSTFQQHVSSLALAKRLKTLCPGLKVIFGGANCEGIMGYETMKQFPFIDVVVSGEADVVLPKLIGHLIAGDVLPEMAGVYTRDSIKPDRDKDGDIQNAESIVNMDDLPYPDFADYFDQLSEIGPDVKITPRLLFETSRGCWWGEKHHCTFCGLNGATMSHRSKSAARAFEELVHLTKSYPNLPISVVDNILTMEYFRSFIPAITDEGLDVELFFEVKANLTKHQIKMLRQAGITQIQPGIESFSTQVLSLMRKGIKGIQNIQLLKWCKELGVSPEWNLLWGFPHEHPQQYFEMAELVPLITHLPPPRGASPIRLDRFSPNFFQSRELGFDQVKAYPSYHFVYRLDEDSVEKLAYFFSYEYQSSQDVGSYTRFLGERVRAWKEQHSESDLLFVDKESVLLVWDLRHEAKKPLIVLSALRRLIYLSCDGMKTVNQIKQFVFEALGETNSTDSINLVLEEFVRLGIMVREDEYYLALALNLDEYSPVATIVDKLFQKVKDLGVLSADGESTVIMLNNVAE